MMDAKILLPALNGRRTITIEYDPCHSLSAAAHDIRCIHSGNGCYRRLLLQHCSVQIVGNYLSMLPGDGACLLNISSSDTARSGLMDTELLSAAVHSAACAIGIEHYPCNTLCATAHHCRRIHTTGQWRYGRLLLQNCAMQIVSDLSVLSGDRSGLLNIGSSYAARSGLMDTELLGSTMHGARSAFRVEDHACDTL